MKLITFAVIVVMLAGCNGFVGDVSVEKPAGKPIAVVDPNYVILRPVTTTPSPGLETATIYGRAVYFRPSERILDLHHLDIRTARIEGPVPSGAYLISINTTPDGRQLLRAWTSENLEKQLGVFVGDRLISAPVIKSRIDDMIVLEGEFTKSQAEAVMNRLRRGGSA